MDKKNIVIVVVVALVFASGGFFGGMKYQQSKTPTRGGGQFAFGAGGQRRAGAAGMGFVNGEVISQDTNSITVKNQNGGSQIVILAPSTTYRKAVDGTSGDVTTGKMVTVTGSTNSDGSLTAQNVQIRDASSTPIGFPGGQRPQ